MKANLGECLLADDMLCISWSTCGTCMTSYKSGSSSACTCSIKERIHVLNKDILVYVQELLCPVINISAVLPFLLKSLWRERQPSASDY